MRLSGIQPAIRSTSDTAGAVLRSRKQPRLGRCGRRAPQRGPAGRRAAAETEGMVALAGGEFLFGSDDEHAYPEDGEGPVRRVSVAPFLIDRHAVSNARFAAFVEATGYVTDADRFGWSFVFAGLLPDDFPPTRGVAQAPWWRAVEGANWEHPAGPQSSIDERLDHPVVHVSHARCAARTAPGPATRLPTEAEWEYAARGGLEGEVYPWGERARARRRAPDERLAGGVPGPQHARRRPLRHLRRRRVRAQRLRTAQHDRQRLGVGRRLVRPPLPRARPPHAPQGPPSGTHRVQKGGSYLCHASYCRRYRVAARQANTPDASAGNLGFRCVAG